MGRLSAKVWRGFCVVMQDRISPDIPQWGGVGGGRLCLESVGLGGRNGGESLAAGNGWRTRGHGPRALVAVGPKGRP